MKVSVIMPVYNSEKYLEEAINSILNQTFSNFELIIINDGSTDSSEEIIKRYNDERIRYYRNDINRGLIYTLNRGIGLAKGEYIARMDSDDISLPKRFEKQVEFLNLNQEFDVVGGWIRIIHENGRNKYYKPESGFEGIKSNMIFRTELVHPLVMYRKTYINKLDVCYSPEYPSCEDYELWARTICNSKFYNIPEILLNYRYLEQSITRIADEDKNKIQRDYLHKNIYRQILKNLKFNVTEEILDLHRSICDDKEKLECEKIEKIEKYLCELIIYNNNSEFIEDEVFKKRLGFWWYNTCRKSKDKSEGIRYYLKSELRGFYRPSIKEILRFFYG